MKYSLKPLGTTEYIEVAKNYYALRSEWNNMFPVERHLELCACIPKHYSKPVFTAQSGCAAHGIARLDKYEVRPYCISENHKRSSFVRWCYGERDQNTKMINGMLVASPMRTVFDLAKYDSSLSLLVTLNDCLFKKLFNGKKIISELEKRGGKHQTKRLLRLMRFATEKCESPLETIGWHAIYQAGIVLPEQQAAIHNEKHIFVARVDMLWELNGRKVILELDGRIKYDDNIDSYQEKLREDKLRALGFEVIRASWQNVMSGELVKTLIEKKIPLRRNFKGTFPD